VAGTMLVGRSRSGSPMRRTMRVRPTSGAPPLPESGSDPNDDGPLADGLDVAVDENVGPGGAAGDTRVDGVLGAVVVVGSGVVRVGADAGGGSGTATGIDCGSRGGATGATRSRARSGRAATAGRSLDATAMRCAPAPGPGRGRDATVGGAVDGSASDVAAVARPGGGASVDAAVDSG
jgi:hypothetical protein